MRAVIHENARRGLRMAVIPSLSRDLGMVPQIGRRGLAEMFRLRRCAPSLNMTKKELAK